MKTSRLLCAGLLTATTIGFVGCSHLASPAARNVAARPARPMTFALSVTVQGGLPPTPEQWSLIQARVSAELLAAGHVLVTDLAIADRILRVEFRPNPSNPTQSGQAVIVAVRDNPLRQVAFAPRRDASPVYRTASSGYPTAFGFGHSSFVNSFHSLYDPSFGFSQAYYGYGNSYYDGYTYSTPTLNPAKPAHVTPVVPVVPPRHGPGHRPPGGHPGERPVCPPLLAVANPAAPAPSRVAYPTDRPTRTIIAASRQSGIEGRSSGTADRAERSRSYTRQESESAFRSVFGGSSSSDYAGSAERYTSYTTHGSADNSAAAARRAESRSAPERSYSRESSYTRDDSSRVKSDYSASSYSPPPSPSYSSSDSFASSSAASYSAPAASSSSGSSGGSSGTHDSSSNNHPH